MRAKPKICVALTLCTLVCSSWNVPVEAQAPPPPINNAVPTPTASLPSISVDTICTGSPVPPGWVRIDDMTDRSRCQSNLTYNVSLIQSLEGLPVGSTVEICTVVVVPLRWFMQSSKWDAKKCGHPTQKSADNVMVIKRAH